MMNRCIFSRFPDFYENVRGNNISAGIINTHGMQVRRTVTTTLVRHTAKLFHHVKLVFTVFNMLTMSLNFFLVHKCEPITVKCNIEKLSDQTTKPLGGKHLALAYAFFCEKSETHSLHGTVDKVDV